MSRWYFRCRALGCFIVDSVAIVEFFLHISDNEPPAIVSFMFLFSLLVVPILSCIYIYKGFKDSQMGVFKYAKTAYDRGLSEQYLFLRGLIVIILFGITNIIFNAFIALIPFAIWHSNAPYDSSNSNTNQSNRTVPAQPAQYSNRLQVKSGTKCCAMCMYFNGSMGCRSMEMRLGGIYVCNRNEEGSCFSMGIKVKAWHGGGCQNFISRY